jgi:hypothetical protein
MKKNTLNTAVLASLAGIAGIANISNAVNINTDGTGQVLIYPYYTVNNGNQTLLSVVNTTNFGKAVKVRILEGRNSREVLDFNLYLSAQDVWTAAIFDTDNVGPANIITFDNSCTAPEFASAGANLNGQPIVPFFNFGYVGDTGPDVLERTREGYIELIEMAEIVENSALSKFITHRNGTPPGCADVATAWTNSGAADPFDADVRNPTGGLFGGGAIVNSGDGTYTNYNANALDGFFVDKFHTRPDSVIPSLNNAAPVSFVFSNGNLIRSTWTVAPARRIDAVSAVFMSELLLNEFTTEAGLNASSEWVITFPTKRFYVDRQTSGSTSVLAPFTTLFGASAATAGTACEALNFDVRDREEGRPNASLGFSPQAPGALPNSLCFEVNVLTFGQALTIGTAQSSSATRILGSNLGRNLNPAIGNTPTRAGWLNINLGVAPGIGVRRMVRSDLSAASTAGGGHVFTGLPATGFWAVVLENNNARPGVRGFYGGAFDHKRGRKCDRVDVNGATVGVCFQ